MTTKIVAVSDLHGALPDIPECDLLLIGGDVCPVGPSHSLEFQWEWVEGSFNDWLKQVPASEIVGIAGNHDFIAEAYPEVMYDLSWHYLQDESIHWLDANGRRINIYGTPWTPKFFNWAFMKEDKDLKAHWDAIPDDVDILITHGPPKYIQDLTLEKVNAGSQTLLKRVRTLTSKLHVFGHIHEGYGQGQDFVNGTTYANVALMNRDYDPINPIMEFQL